MSGFKRVASKITHKITKTPKHTLTQLFMPVIAAGVFTTAAAKQSFASDKPIPRKVLEQVMREADANSNEGLSSEEKELKGAFFQAIKKDGLDPYVGNDGCSYLQAILPNDGYVVVRVADDRQGITDASPNTYIEYGARDDKGHVIKVKILNGTERLSIQGQDIDGTMMVLRGGEANKISKSLPPNGVLVLRSNRDMTDVKKMPTTEAAVNALDANTKMARLAGKIIVRLRAAMERLAIFGVQPGGKAPPQTTRSSNAAAKTPQQIYEKLFGNDFQSNDVLPIASKSPMRVTVDGGIIHGKALHNDNSYTEVYVYPNGEVQNHIFKSGGASVATIIQANGDITMIHQKADEDGAIHAFTDKIKRGSDKAQSTYAVYKGEKEVKSVKIKSMQPKRMIEILSRDALDNGKLVAQQAGDRGRNITFPVLAQ